MQITAEILEAVATEQLKATKTLPARYQPGDLSGAIRAAARAAGNFNKDAFVILGNSYGRGCWHVSIHKTDVTSLAINSGKRAFRVTPAREIYRLTIEA